MRAFAVACCIVTCAAAPVVADEGMDRRKAEQLFVQANKAASAGDHARAVVLYERAYASFPSPAILINWGKSLFALGRRAEAAERFDEYVAAAERPVAASPA